MNVPNELYWNKPSYILIIEEGEVKSSQSGHFVIQITRSKYKD